MAKTSIKSLINNIKSKLREEPKAPKPIANTSGTRERDMRQEAIDMGSHGASEMFGQKEARHDQAE